MARRPPTQQELVDLVREHIPYEVAMLRHTFNLLQWTGTLLSREISNALIESFAVHARNLIEFLSGKDNAVDAHLLASEFSKATFQTTWWERLNQQVSHITSGRVTDKSDKIGPAERQAIHDSILAEMKTFRSSLNSEFTSLWDQHQQAQL